MHRSDWVVVTATDLAKGDLLADFVGREAILAAAAPTFSGLAPFAVRAGATSAAEARHVPAWHLLRGDVLLGTLRFVQREAGWTVCGFEPTPAFEWVRPLFEAELDLFNRYADWDAWEAAYASITALELTLQPLEGGPPIEGFLLHIDGREAWYRGAEQEEGPGGGLWDG